MPDKDNDRKLYYSIGEVAQMFGVTEPTLRFWETKFPQLSPRKAGRNIRQYRREDLEVVRLIHHLVKEQGLTIAGAVQRLSRNREETLQTFEVVQRLKHVRQELADMCRALDGFSYEEVERLKENIDQTKGHDTATR